MSLTPAERSELLRIAREAIAAPREAAPAGEDPRRGAVFVTIRSADGDLRGCIGSLDDRKPLEGAVREAACAAAFEDPRFPPLDPAELPGVSLEISVLSPFERVERVEEIVPGTHGLLIRDGFRSGLLLPQVASEYGWGREEFLDHLCRKAGLPPGRWRSEGVLLEKFTADVFGEVAD